MADEGKDFDEFEEEEEDAGDQNINPGNTISAPTDNKVTVEAKKTGFTAPPKPVINGAIIKKEEPKPHVPSKFELAM